MTKIKNNIFLLSLTTLFLFLSCLLINGYSNYSVKADEINQEEIYTSNNGSIFLCGIIDPANDEHGYILYFYEFVVGIDDIDIRYNFNFYEQTLNFNYNANNSYPILNNEAYTQTIQYTINEIKAISANFYSYFDYAQYPIESARDYTNIELEIELEYELFNGNFDYYYINLEIPLNDYFDNPYVFNLCEHNTILIYNVELAYEQGYTRGYRDGLSNNNENLGQAYEQGYEDGYNDSSLNPMTFISSIFSGINNIFSVEIFPGFKIWYLIGAPLIVALIIGVLKFLR